MNGELNICTHYTGSSVGRPLLSELSLSISLSVPSFIQVLEIYRSSHKDAINFMFRSITEMGSIKNP